MKWILLRRHRQCPFVIHCIDSRGNIQAAHVVRAEYTLGDAQSFVKYLNERGVGP